MLGTESLTFETDPPALLFANGTRLKINKIMNINDVAGLA